MQDGDRSGRSAQGRSDAGSQACEAHACFGDVRALRAREIGYPASPRPCPGRRPGISCACSLKRGGGRRTAAGVRKSFTRGPMPVEPPNSTTMPAWGKTMGEDAVASQRHVRRCAYERTGGRGPCPDDCHDTLAHMAVQRRNLARRLVSQRQFGLPGGRSWLLRGPASYLRCVRAAGPVSASGVRSLRVGILADTRQPLRGVSGTPWKGAKRYRPTRRPTSDRIGTGCRCGS